jgi:hypothetical protein
VTGSAARVRQAAPVPSAGGRVMQKKLDGGVRADPVEPMSAVIVATNHGWTAGRSRYKDKVVGAVGCSWRRFLVAGVAASHTEHKGDKSPAVRGPNSAKGDGGDKTVGCTGSKSKTM